MGSVIATLLLLVACDCETRGPTRNGCVSADDCPSGEECVDDTCVASDAGGGDAGPSVPFDAGGCSSQVLCGSPPVCCSTGSECIDGQCLPACASEVRCGVDLGTCCDEGQVCLSGSCTDPGDACADSFGCPEGAFCEPTLGRCLPQFMPVTCEAEPVFGRFAAEVEWEFTTTSQVPECLHGISSPVIVDLTGDGVPEVVANFACDDDWQHGVLRALDGRDGTELWAATDLPDRTNGRVSIAAGDLDGDSTPEIVAVGRPTNEGGRALAFSASGRVIWRSTEEDGVTPLPIDGFMNGAPTLADLDEDGTPEVVLGALVLNADGTRRWSRDLGPAEGTNDNYAGGIAVVVDLDLDEAPEIVTGYRAYEADGTPLWTSPVTDGYPAVAQFDDDPQPEVVLVTTGEVYLLDGLTGRVEWGPIPLPGEGRGGPPTIANFDTDDDPEIGVAGARSYSVYDRAEEGGVLWSMTTEDVSSNATGSSVFDFEGDGPAEVVYADECYLRVYRGSDGEVLLQVPNSSATIHEYPLVADVDGDGNSEIVIVANDRLEGIRTQCLSNDASWNGARRGLFVYGDTRDQWVRTRRVWHQHAYHVTNVRPDGTIPASEPRNWETPGLNNYRQNVQGEGVFNAPDLKILALEVRLDGCPTSATLRARVTNEGNLGVEAGVLVAFYPGTPGAPGELLGTAMTTSPLLPGGTTVVELNVPLTGPAPYAFVAVVDDDGTGAGTVAECDEDDNAAAIGELDCDLLL